MKLHQFENATLFYNNEGDYLLQDGVLHNLL